MQDGKIKVRFDDYGRPDLKAEGFVGEACKAHFDLFANAVAGSGEIVPTSEMYQIDTTTEETDTETY